MHEMKVLCLCDLPRPLTSQSSFQVHNPYYHISFTSVVAESARHLGGVGMTPYALLCTRCTIACCDGFLPEPLYIAAWRFLTPMTLREGQLTERSGGQVSVSPVWDIHCIDIAIMTNVYLIDCKPKLHQLVTTVDASKTQD